MDKVKDFFYGESKPATKRSRDSVQPHRCAKHVEDLMVAITNFEVEDQQEPPRHFPPEVKPDHKN
ncbi:hypothetical protein BGX20_010541 [Mortierella sp. AD010]|nr:hypothetical protein BGX20_010541 [Mortierella sp. AD010]